MQPYTYSSLPFVPEPVRAPAPPPGVPAAGPPRPEIDAQALGPDGFLLPHHRTFQAVYNLFSKTYSYRWDEAVRHGLENAQAMRRDTYFRALMAERLDPLGHWDWDVQADPDPLNPKDPYSADKALVARMLRAEAAACPDLMKFRRHLGWCAWFGRVGNQVLYEPNPAAGLAWNPRVPVAWEPCDGDKLQWSWGEGGTDRRGHWCVLINPTCRGEYPPEETAISDRSTILRLRRPDFRRRWVIGTHEIEDAPYEDVAAAGRARGVGLRDFVYWGWWLRDEMLSWMVSLAEKAGTLGILLFKYPAGNDKAKKQAEQNAREVSNRNALTVPVEQGTRGDDYGVEVVALPTNGLQFLKEVTFDYFDKHFERLFIGQTASSSTEGHGLGGTGIARLQEDTKHSRLKFDAENQAEYLTTDYIGTLKTLNHRDAPGVYRWKYQLADPKVKEKLEGITKAASLPGVKLTYKADEVRELVGMSKPDPGDEIVGGDDPTPAVPGMPGAPGVPGAPPAGGPATPPAPGTPPGGAGVSTSPPAPPAGPPQPGTPPTDEEAADAVAGLIGELNAAIGQPNAPGNRAAILAAIRAKRGAAAQPQPYRAATPPWPGAVFDESRHHWVNPTRGQGGGDHRPPGPPAPPQRPPTPQAAGAAPANHRLAPLDTAALVASLGREHAAELADPQARQAAATVAGRLYETVAGWLFRLSPAVVAMAEGILDTPDDMRKFGYNPAALGTHHENGDPVKAATGVSAHLAMTIASHVLATAWVKGKRAVGYDADGIPFTYAAGEPAKFASTQVQLTGDAAGRLLALAAAIPEAELADDGREDEPHVTVKYGLHTDDPAAVYAAVREFGPVSLRLTRLAAFRSADTGRPYDVLYCEVDSPDLHRLNAAVAAGCGHTDTWPTYRPHATVAYLRPGAADRYVREAPPLDAGLTADRITFSDRLRRHTTVMLVGPQEFAGPPAPG